MGINNVLTKGAAWCRLTRLRVMRWLDFTNHHHTHKLPSLKRSVVPYLMKQIFEGIQINPVQFDPIKNLPPEAVVVYATKYKSNFDFLFYRTRYAQEGLPVPSIGLDYHFRWLQPVGRLSKIVVAHIDHLIRHRSWPDPFDLNYMITNTAIPGQAWFVSLIESGGFERRFVRQKTDAFTFLLEIQKKTDRPIYIVPQLMAYSRAPERKTPLNLDFFWRVPEKPSLFRRLILLFRNPTKIFVEISDPINLQEFLTATERTNQTSARKAQTLRRALTNQFNRHRMSIIGPILKSNHELKERILTDPALQAFMNEYAVEKDQDLYKVRSEAEGYFREIAARYRNWVIRILEKFVGWLLTSMFDGYTTNEETLHRIKMKARRGPLVLIPCHRSHIDYLILSYLLYHFKMPCPLIAAGKNLSFFPLGTIFRGGGAFFIRRTFKGLPLYTKVFSAYIHTLLREGFNIEFFIEGGRSRSGKMLTPKLGMLSFVLDGFRKGACDDLTVVPVFIGYDRVPEESAYVHEIEGGKKESESLSQVIRARRFLKKRFGKVYIQFHDPISVREYTQAQQLDHRSMDDHQFQRVVQTLGRETIAAINTASIITPHGLVAAALLTSMRPTLDRKQVMEIVELFLAYLTRQNALLADTLTVNYAHAINSVLDLYEQRKLIEISGSKKDQIQVIEPKRPILEYYKNNCIAAFSPAIYAASAILALDAFQVTLHTIEPIHSDLCHIFADELVPPLTPPYKTTLSETIDGFVEDFILMPHEDLPDTYNVTSAGLRKIKLFAGFLRPLLEAYQAVAIYLAALEDTDKSTKEKLQKITKQTNRLYRRKELSCPEAISPINFKNALAFYSKQGIQGAQESQLLKPYQEILHRHLESLTRH